MQASAQHITWMTITRVIGGIGCGHLNTIVPVWTSELADDHFSWRKMMLTGSSAIGVLLLIGGILAHEVTRSKAVDPGKTQGYGADVASILFLHGSLFGSSLADQLLQLGLSDRSLSSRNPSKSSRARYHGILNSWRNNQ